MAAHDFVGGYEIDPSRANQCQICGLGIYEHAVRVELPRVRVRGFDRMFKRLGEILAKAESSPTERENEEKK